MIEKSNKRRALKRWQMARLRRLSYIPRAKRSGVQQDRVEQLERGLGFL